VRRMQLDAQSSGAFRFGEHVSSSRVMRAEDWPTLKHLTPAEFHSPERMGYEHVKRLDAMREKAGVPIRRISSDYRTREHNKAVGGAKDSAHCDEPICDATDIVPLNNYERFCLIEAGIAVGFTRIGIYKDGSLHFDSTEDKRPSPRLWCVVENPA
jgi:hypothetical protein